MQTVIPTFEEKVWCFPLCASNFSSFLCPLVASLSYPGCCPFHPGDITPSLPSAPWQSPDSLKNLSGSLHQPCCSCLQASLFWRKSSQSSQHSSWSRSVRNCHGRESWQRKFLEVPCHNQSFSEKKKKISGQGELTGILRKKAQDGVKLARKERSPHEGG